jgi:hypothetical protein
MLWQFLCALLFVGQAQAQVCQLPEGVECTLNEPSAFKVITTSKTFSQMIADGDLLPQAISESEPQFLVVCQTITDNLPGWYIFAYGSEIVFLNNSSGLVVNSGANLQFRSSYLHGCQKLWDRIRVNGGGLNPGPLDGQRQAWLRWGGQLPTGLYLLEVAADQSAPQVLKLAIDKN